MISKFCGFFFFFFLVSVLFFYKPVGVKESRGKGIRG